MHPAVTVRKAFPGRQEPNPACPFSLVMGQMYQKSNMLSLWYQLTAQIKAKLAGDLTPSRAGLMADLVLMGKPDSQKPGNLHTHTQDLEWKCDSSRSTCSSCHSACCPSPPGEAAGRRPNVGLAVWKAPDLVFLTGRP